MASVVTPPSRLHRTVKKLRRFVESKDMSGSPQLLMDCIASTESVLGYYQGDTDKENILFAERSVVFVDPDNGEINRIPYEQISGVEFPLPALDSVDLLLRLVYGATAKMRVVGRQGNFRDVFEVGRFFMRVAADVARSR